MFSSADMFIQEQVLNFIYLEKSPYWTNLY